MLSTQYPCSSQSTFTYSNENSPNFKRSLCDESPYRSCKKRCSENYFNVESTPSPFKRTYRDEFPESDTHEFTPSAKRSRLADINRQSMANEVLTEPRIVDITSGEVLEEVSSISPHCNTDMTPVVDSRALVRHLKSSQIPQERLQILFNIPSNSKPHTQLPQSGLDQFIMQVVPYQPSYHWQDQPIYATIEEIEDNSEMEID